MLSSIAIQLATAIGAIAIATSSSNEKLQVAERLGARHLINYKEHPDWHEEVLRIVRHMFVIHSTSIF